MSTAKISRRYAVALYELISDGVKLADDLASVAAIAAVDEVAAVLNEPEYPAELKVSILTKAAGGSIGGEVSNLLSMLAGRNKLSLLPEINAQVEAMVRQAERQLNAEVTVASSIDAATEEKLVKALSASTGKDVALSIKEDHSILGGMVVRIGDRKIDYSLRTKLTGLRRALAS